MKNYNIFERIVDNNSNVYPKVKVFSSIILEELDNDTKVSISLEEKESQYSESLGYEKNKEFIC